MKHSARLARLQRELNAQQRQAQDDAQHIQFIEVYCDGVLLEVIRLGAAARTASHERT